LKDGLLKKEMVHYALISSKWFKIWAEYLDLDPLKLYEDDSYRNFSLNFNEISSSISEGKIFRASIDNSRLIREIGRPDLVPNLKEFEEFYAVHDIMWSVLSRWYGGGPKIIRQAIKCTVDGKQSLELDLYPLNLIFEIKNFPSRFTFSFSKSVSIYDLRERICGELKLSVEDVCIWTSSEKASILLDDDLSKTLNELNITQNQLIYFDTRLENGKFQGYEKTSETKANVGEERPKVDSLGVIGLSNLGNTCFMNSTLHCLSLSSLLTKYFLENLYLWEINQKNPLGMEGKVALSYGSLIHKIHVHCSKYDVLAPRGIKSTIGKFAPQFVGFQQHDAHEFLQFLLDGLHEGLNRVTEKPYVVIEDSKGRPDSIVAEEQWDAFLKRNQSVIVDLFMGQLKSTLRWNCGRENIKFDPYSVLSLPLLKPTHRTIEITLVYENPSKIPTRYCIEIMNNSSIRDLRKELSDLCKIQPTSLYLVELYNGSTYQALNVNIAVSSIRPNDVVFAYEVPKKANFNVSSFEEEKKESLVDQTDFVVGKMFEVFHEKHNKWFRAIIQELKDEEILFDFRCCIENCSEWISRTSEKIKPLSLGLKEKSMNVHQFEDLDIEKSTICIHICQRLCVPQEDYFFNPVKPTIIGIPFIIFCDPKRLTSGMLYQMVWEKFRRFISSTNESEFGLNTPFVLSRVKKNSVQCSQCSWLKLCIGCEIEFQNDVLVGINHDEHLSIDWDPLFFDKYLNLKEMMYIHDHSSAKKLKDFAQKRMTLRDCMAQFTKPESMSGDSAPYCSECKEAHEATKILEPWNAPPILIIHLKRLVQGIKIATFVEFPVKSFDPSPYLSSQKPDGEENLYDLYAVVNHFGNASSGHYVTYGLERQSGSWFCFDDSRVTKIEEKDVCSKNAYMLFYVRRNALFDDLMMPKLKEKIGQEIPEELAILSENAEQEKASSFDDVCPWFLTWPSTTTKKLSFLTNRSECQIS
jgi:ubiquitin C-terminal hydrolase